MTFNLCWKSIVVIATAVSLIGGSFQSAGAFDFSIPIPVSIPIPANFPIPLPFFGHSSGYSSQQQDPSAAAFFKATHEGFEAYQNHDYALATSKFKQAESLRPEESGTHVNLALALEKEHHPEDAIAELNRAIELDSNNSSAWLDLVGACIDADQLEGAVAAAEEYVRRFPHGKEVANLTATIKATKEQIEERNQARVSGLGAPNEHDYLALVCHQGGTRWNLAKMPLKVNIADGSRTAYYKPEFSPAMIKAFKQWEIASGGNIRFTPVDDPAQADINIIWCSDVNQLHDRTELGEARSLSAGGVMTHSDIVMLTRNRNFKMEITAQLLYSTALHEIGHALGLDGHSDSSRDIMYFSNTDMAQAVSMRDIGTLQRLYTLPQRALIAAALGGTALPTLPQQQGADGTNYGALLPTGPLTNYSQPPQIGQPMQYGQYPPQMMAQAPQYQPYPQYAQYPQYQQQPVAQPAQYAQYPQQAMGLPPQYQQYPVQQASYPAPYQQYPPQPMTQPAQYQQYPPQYTSQPAPYQRSTSSY